ncbi:MAG: hypothetical protein QM831_08265 [Kofleriaceae bacterium]
MSRTIARGFVRYTARFEPLAQFVMAHAATGTSAAGSTDVFDRARAFIDHRVDIAASSGVTHADDHRLKLIMHFKTGFVKASKCVHKRSELL